MMATNLKNTSKNSLDSKTAQAFVEETAENLEREWIQQWPLLREKTEEELEGINKQVLKKLDWVFLPSITAMLLMKYGSPFHLKSSANPELTRTTATWTASMSRTLGSLVSKPTSV
jgi:hypothetical protein